MSFSSFIICKRIKKPDGCRYVGSSVSLCPASKKEEPSTAVFFFVPWRCYGLDEHKMFNNHHLSSLSNVREYSQIAYINLMWLHKSIAPDYSLVANLSAVHEAKLSLQKKTQKNFKKRLITLFVVIQPLNTRNWHWYIHSNSIRVVNVHVYGLF